MGEALTIQTLICTGHLYQVTKSLDERLIGFISFAVQKDTIYQKRKQRFRYAPQHYHLLMIK